MSKKMDTRQDDCKPSGNGPDQDHSALDPGERLILALEAIARGAEECEKVLGARKGA